MYEICLTTWCWLLQLLVLLQTLISASSGPLGTGCIWRSSISSTLPNEQTISPRKECNDGQLYWYYPKGSLVVTFTHESRLSKFQLCFTPIEMSEVYHRNGKDGMKVPFLEKFMKGIECLQSEDGEVVVEFVSNSEDPKLQGTGKSRLKIIEYFRKDDQT